MPGQWLPEIVTIWPGVTSKIHQWKMFIERMDRWSWGEGFTVETNDAGRKVFYSPPRAVFAGVATSIITARATNTVGSGTFKTRSLAGSTLSDAITGLTVKSNFSTAVASGKAIMVGYDGSTYWLIGADCP